MATPQRFRPRALMGLVLAALVSGGRVRAQENQLPPPAAVEGIPAGPCYLTPFLGLGVSYETNPFYQPVSKSDVITRANLALGAMFPFHKSYFRVGYDGLFRRFAQTTVTNTDSRDVLGELSLLFGTFDRLVAFANETSGASEALKFDGGETTYDGTPFHYANYTVGAERAVPGHLGYQATATWNRLNFDQTDVSFFEFHGYDATLDARVPLSSDLWVVAGAAVRRYDHVRADDPTRSVYRQEHSNTIRGGVEGILASGKSYHAILGYDVAQYPGGAGSDFKGLVADGAIDLEVGPSTTVSVFASRRRWSSFYGDNNYYLASVVGSSALHRWSSGSEVGGTLEGGQSVYPDPVSIAAGGPRRRDLVFGARAHGTWAFARYCGLRLTYEAQFRHSNATGVDYDAQTFGLELVFGWR
jgi:hypothetical protein